jgi:hypothetical protein
MESVDHIITLCPSLPLHKDCATLMGANIKRVAITNDLLIALMHLLKLFQKRKKVDYCKHLEPCRLLAETCPTPTRRYSSAELRKALDLSVIPFSIHAIT